MPKTELIPVNHTLEKPIRPSIPRLLNAIRCIGHSLEDTVGDLVDNAIPAQASKISVFFSGRKTFDRLEVADNGHGMDDVALTEALRLGSLVEYSSNSLSKYGMGLKAAALAQGQRLTVLTQKQGGDLLKAVLDIRLIEERKDYVVLFTQPSDEEAELFEQRTGGIGTVLVIDQIYPERTMGLTACVNKTRRMLAETFHRFMTATDPVTFEINGQPFQPIDPLFVGDPLVTELLEPKQLEFTDAKGNTVTIAVRANQLPHPPSHTNRAEIKERYNIGLKNIGFYVYRANRLVRRADTLGIFTPDPKLYAFRASVDFNPDSDEFFSLDVAKRRIVLTESVRSHLEQLFTPALNHSRTLWKNATKKQPGDEETSIHKPASSQINAKDPLLSTGRKERTLPQEKEKKASKKFTRIKPPKDNLRVLPVDDLPDALLWEPSLDTNGQVYVRLNKSHPFYVQVYQTYASDDPELVEAVDYLLWALAHAEYNIGYDNDKKIAIMEDLRGFASRNLRKLLSE